MNHTTEQECWQILPENADPVSQPLVKHQYSADPSAHVFEGRVYIYPSHDIDAGIPFNDNGDHFAMCDYHVFSMDEAALNKLSSTDVQSAVVDHGMALHVDDVPWAERQMWAPDAAHKDGTYYFYFPARNYEGKFQIGVATAATPHGPFKAEPLPIENSYSIDPAVFQDDDDYYIYFGGLWGGQLQEYRNNKFDETYSEPAAGETALNPIMAKLSDDMKSFAEEPKELLIVDSNGEALKSDDERRFFEAAWMHKHNGVYYFSYSTGNHHTICYATSNSPYGPFTYGGCILEPVLGWTTHHSICEMNGQSYLFYHDSTLSEGVTHLRSIKATPISYDDEGKIITIKPYSV